MKPKYTLSGRLNLDEGLDTEFKGLSKIPDRDVMPKMVEFAREYINAFLNGDGGTLFLGVEDDGMVSGILLNHKQRDDIRKRITDAVKEFFPAVEAHLYEINFCPVYDAKGNKIDDLWIIDVTVRSGDAPVYWASNHKGLAYIKTQGGISCIPPSMLERRIKLGKSNLLAKEQENNQVDYRRVKGGHQKLNSGTIVRNGANFKFTCNIPAVLNDGHGEVEFVQEPFTGLHIELSNRTILDHLMMGLGTPLSWGARPYLKQFEIDGYYLTIDKTKVKLNALQARSFCDVVDDLCGQYKSAIMKTEDILQTWEFGTAEVDGAFGFTIVSLPTELWVAMSKYSFARDTVPDGTGQEISIEAISECIRLHRNWDEIMTIYATHETFTGGGELELISNLIFEVDDLHLQSHLDRPNANSWKSVVGPKGIWTAEYARLWLIDHYIPLVLSKSNISTAVKMNAEQTIGEERSKTRLSTIVDLKSINKYLLDIQMWAASLFRVESDLILPYYRFGLELLNNIDHRVSLDYHYISSKLAVASRAFYDEESPYVELRDVSDLVSEFQLHTNRVQQKGFEDGRILDMLSRVVIMILEQGKFRESQYLINQARRAIEPLWRECRFCRHIQT